MPNSSIDECFRYPVIPVTWDPTPHKALLTRASMVILQGGKLGELSGVLDIFSQPPLEHLAVFVHIDLVAGLENNDAGLEFLHQFERTDGIVSVHHYLAKPARQLGLKAIVRLFLSDSRAVDRGLAVIKKSRPDAIEILPAAVATKVVDAYATCPVPRIAGGLCSTAEDVKEALDSGCKGVSSTSPELWELNGR